MAEATQSVEPQTSQPVIQANQNPNSRAAKRKLKHASKRIEPTKQIKASFTQETKRAGLLVTDEFQKAVNECKERVEAIAKECRRTNRRFRDVEFDLQHDILRCLYGASKNPEFYRMSDTQRVTQLFEKPSFFIDGATSSDIQQGSLGDCWFLSALATLTSSEGLIEKICVARDEKVGVYGFIFFRDWTWVPVIIDDILFTQVPKFEELSYMEKALYHNDKDNYNKSARKTGKSLLFARSGTHGETWVPLIEKAYAKIHGNYAALSGGFHGEGVEDLTGGVSTFISTNDILDKDQFWKEELLRANHDRLFGCSFGELDQSRSGVWNATVNGLMGGHAYSVLRAVEYNGKRFVIVRNPWGNSEWTGRWSDGSKEWTKEWLGALEKIGHTFGDDGQFVMEYDDFLENWEDIERVRLFDETWVMSSQYLDVTTRPFPSAWSYGDVSFTIEVPAGTHSVIVLSRLDNRYYEPFDNAVYWSFDFIVYKKGETTPICYSSPSPLGLRSVNAEVELEAGTYVVHVRIDRTINSAEVDLNDGSDNGSDSDAGDGPLNNGPLNPGSLQPGNIARVLTEKAKSHAISMNANKEKEAHLIPIPLSILAGQDLSELEEKAKAASEALQKEMQALTMSDDEIKRAEGKSAEEPKPDGEGDAKADVGEGATADEKKDGDDGDKEVEEKEKEEEEKEKEEKDEDEEKKQKKKDKKDRKDKKKKDKKKDKKKKKKSKKSKKDESSDSESSDSDSSDSSSSDDSDSESESEAIAMAMCIPGGMDQVLGAPELNDDDHEEMNRITLGLRVYTSKDAVAKISGQLRHEMKLNFDGLAITAST